MVLHNAGFDNFASRIDDAANRSLGSNRNPLPPTAVHRFEMTSFEQSSVFVKVPPGDTVHRSNNGSIWTCPAFVESVFDFTLPALRTEAG